MVAQVRQPKGIKKQALEAERLQKELLGNPGEPAPDTVQEPITAKAEPPAKAEVKPNSTESVKDTKGAEPAVKPDTDWEARFKGMKATYDREVPKLRGELSTAHTAVDDVKSQMSVLQERLEQLEKTPVAAAPEPIVFTDEEREQYGEGYITMMEKVAEQSNSVLIKQLMDVQTELAHLKQGQEATREHVVVTDEQRFFDGMIERVGADWETINNDQSFLEFLDEEVPYSGKTKLDFLREARKGLDLVKVSGIFNDFKATLTTGEPPEEVPSIPEELMTPDNQGGGNTPPTEQHIYTSDEVTQFYTDKTKGRYKGKESEARAIEKDIIAAGTQGRIVTRRGQVTA